MTTTEIDSHYANQIMKNKYYIVINEWNYPTDSGRRIIGDFNTRDEAAKIAEKEYEKEKENFLKITNGKMYEPACGMVKIERLDVDDNQQVECGGYMLNSSIWEEDNIFFHSIIIERDIFKQWTDECDDDLIMLYPV